MYNGITAMNWKGVEFDSVPVHLVKEGGQQLTDDYRGKNQQLQ